MKLLLPLGLLGLLGIIILILIYLLKPNYQQRVISSTYVWKLSLKYKRKRIPISILRSLLILLCQILIITACAFILADPVIREEVPEVGQERVVVIDGSAGMRTKYENKTRFELAVERAQEIAKQTADEGGVFTAILANPQANYLVERSGAENYDTVSQKLAELLGEEGNADDDKCSYEEGDIAGAVSLADRILMQNPAAEVTLITGTSYVGMDITDGKLKVENVSREGEWNAAILNAGAELVENYYKFWADISVYRSDGGGMNFLVRCMVKGANYYINSEGETVGPDGSPLVGNSYDTELTPTSVDGDLQMTSPSIFVGQSGDVVHVEWDTSDSENGNIYSYDSVWIHIDDGVQDSFDADNNFFLDGGMKQSVRIQYASSKPNIFFAGFFMGIRDTLRNRWTIDYDEVRNGASPEMEGYDFYVFERTMPATLPTDGVVLLVNPDKVPENLTGITLGDRITTEDPNGFLLAAGEPHPITQYVTPENLPATAYRRILTYDGYTPLLFCGGDPVLLVRNEMNAKVAILCVETDFSMAGITYDFPMLMLNMFNYFVPSTVSQYLYEVGDTAALSARGPELTVSGGGQETTVDSFPQDYKFTRPGEYTLQQRISPEKAPIVENVFVKVSSKESDLFREEELRVKLSYRASTKSSDYALLLYFASVLVGLLFLEWLLHSREGGL